MFSPPRSPSSHLLAVVLLVLLLVSSPDSSEGADGFPQGNKRMRVLCMLAGLLAPCSITWCALDRSTYMHVTYDVDRLLVCDAMQFDLF